MNREVIERLAIDSAAGELNEDVEVMLQSYLDKHPQAKQWAEDVRSVFDETEAVIRTKTAHAGGQKVTPSMTPVLRLIRLNWLPVVRWAATIILGIAIGFTAGRWVLSGETPRIVTHEPSPSLKPTETVTDLKEKYVGTFWGDKMLSLLEPQPGRQSQARPRVAGSLEKYRQYIKEMNDE